jgi:rSAM/selenodomain-associated transferase 1
MIFTRCPQPGTTKTRLIPVLGAEGAARLQRRMTEHILAEALALGARRDLAVSVHYAGGSRRDMIRWLGEAVALRSQASGDLGRRMHGAFEWLFGTGAQRGLLAGSDIPGLDRGILGQALHHLDRQDLVLGPARDGGYYLVGMDRSVPAADRRSLFASIPWGTRKVLDLTLAAASQAGLSLKLLPPLDDIDRHADLAHFKGELIAAKP